MKYRPLETLARIAEIEYSSLIVQIDYLVAKLRILVKDGSFIDIWVSEKLSNRFGFHWERRHLDGKMFRYDNFPDTHWVNLTSFPFHFHQEYQENVIDAPFARDIEDGFRDFLSFVKDYLEKRGEIV